MGLQVRLLLGSMLGDGSLGLPLFKVEAVDLGPMPLLWENLARQLDRVRAAESTSSAVVDGTGAVSRQQRLQAALAAIKDKGNPLMVEALKAALEGREARLELPELPNGLDLELSGPEAYLRGMPKEFRPQS